MALAKNNRNKTCLIYRYRVGSSVCGVFETCFSFSSSSCRRCWMQLLAWRKAFLWARSVRTRTNTPDRFTPISSAAFATSYKDTKEMRIWKGMQKSQRKPTWTQMEHEKVYTNLSSNNNTCGNINLNTQQTHGAMLGLALMKILNISLAHLEKK